VLSTAVDVKLPIGASVCKLLRYCKDIIVRHHWVIPSMQQQNAGGDLLAALDGGGLQPTMKAHDSPKCLLQKELSDFSRL